MTLTEFVELLALDWDAVLALAGIMAVGIFALVQTLKVLGLLASERVVAYAAIAIGLIELAMVIAGYFFPTFITVGLFIYGAALAMASAVNGYKYAFKPVIERLFPKAEISTDDLS